MFAPQQPSEVRGWRDPDHQRFPRTPHSKSFAYENLSWPLGSSGKNELFLFYFVLSFECLLSFLQGGGVEFGEDPKVAAVRELMEEAGVVLNAEERDAMTLLGAWESVFPTFSDEGFPIRHHVVFYFMAEMKVNAEEVQDLLKIDPGEVAQAVFVPKATVARFLARHDRDNFDREISAPAGEEVEALPGNRMALGTEFILQMWLNRSE